MNVQGYDTIAAVPTKLILVNTRRRRLLLLLPAALIIAAAYPVTRWYLGNTLAQYAPNRETAQLALRLAPTDPQTHFAVAVFNEENLSPEGLARAVAEYERAASLSPNDYRLWQALGRARERAGDTAGSELALRRAHELAPSYANPRWLLGNLLLRLGRDREAFAELRRASEDLPSLRPQVFSLAWTVYLGDPAQVIAALGDTPATRASLIAALLRQKRVDDGLSQWSALDENQKREQAETGAVLRGALLQLGRFRDAARVSQEFAPAGAEQQAAPGVLMNGGFERDINLSGEDLFGWQVAAAAEAQINIDRSRAHSGTRSLLLAFNSQTGRDFRNVEQLVLVLPDTAYRLIYYQRTEELKSASTLSVWVSAAGVESRTPLAVSAPLPTGTNEWQEVQLEFHTPQGGEAVWVKLVRQPCTDAICPIYGKVWYDDFNLQRIGTGAGDRSASTTGATAAGSR